MNKKMTASLLASALCLSVGVVNAGPLAKTCKIDGIYGGSFFQSILGDTLVVTGRDMFPMHHSKVRATLGNLIFKSKDTARRHHLWVARNGEFILFLEGGYFGVGVNDWRNMFVGMIQNLRLRQEIRGWTLASCESGLQNIWGSLEHSAFNLTEPTNEVEGLLQAFKESHDGVEEITLDPDD